MTEAVREIEIQGRTVPFNIIDNLSKPCPQCGVPACGKEYYLWVQNQDQYSAVVFDGGMFDVIGEDFFTHNIKKLPYGELPLFMRQWNECIGWNEFLNEDSCEISQSDFIKSLELIKKSELTDWVKAEFEELYQVLSRFAQTAILSQLFILRT